MRKNIYIALFSVGLLGACNDQLDLNPIGAVSQDSFYTTASDANAAVIACYNALMAYHTGDAHITGMDMWGDIQSSDAEPHPDGVAWNQIYQYTLQPNNGELANQWFQIYEGIYRTNQALEKIPSIDMDETLKARLLNEAYFLRGWWMLRLAKRSEEHTSELQSRENL